MMAAIVMLAILTISTHDLEMVPYRYISTLIDSSFLFAVFVTLSISRTVYEIEAILGFVKMAHFKDHSGVKFHSRYPGDRHQG